MDALEQKTVVVVGGGFSGALFALKLHAAKPDWRIVIVESARRLGRGVAYGACSSEHRLNVPVARMELGLDPGFGQWLNARHQLRGHLQSQDSFAPRELFGTYMEERVTECLSGKGWNGLHAMRGEAVRFLRDPHQGVLLTDGREITADIIVLAMGNLPPRPPGGPDRRLYDTGYFVPDPWSPGALDDIASDEPLLLIGTGLTTVDVAIRLSRSGHRGSMLAISRRGLIPTTHAQGGTWPQFLQEKLPASPRNLVKVFRTEVARAMLDGIPWQRVFDAARPAIPGVWAGWDNSKRRQFLRHLRPWWDIHRHRMAPVVSAEFKDLLATGRLATMAARLEGYREIDSAVEISLRRRGGAKITYRAGTIVNCTGPGADFDRIAIPLIADLRERGLGCSDELGLGLQTKDCALIDKRGAVSQSLFALGPLTKPAWWEIVAVPEIALQIDRLVRHIAGPRQQDRPLIPSDFLGIGEGI